MIILKFLRRHWGKLLLLLFILWYFEIHLIDSTFELLGFNSGRMVDVQKAGHLAPLPLQRTHLKVKETSSIFSHIITIYFVAKPEIVSRWLQDSPGFQEARLATTMPDGATRYILYPKAHGVVYVSADQTEVGINLGQAIDGPTGESPIPPRQH